MKLYTIKSEKSTFYEIKKSTFYAHVVTFDRFDETRARLKKEHPKSRHIVWATRYLNEFNQIVENSSDDGEPKGTSGPSVLNVLRGANLINVAVLIVRYFGGIKLGTGGLVRAYSSACNEVLNVADLIIFESLKSFKIKITFSQIQKVEYLLNLLSLEIKSREFGIDGALFLVDVPSSIEQNFFKEFELLRYEGVEIS